MMGRSKSRSGGDSRILPGEGMVTPPITPSCPFHCQESLCASAESHPGVSGVEDRPRRAWWRSLMALPGANTKVKRSEDKRPDSKHTAWAKMVCPVKASARKSSASPRRGTAGFAKGRQGKTEAEQAWLPDPNISFFDINRVILRGSDLERETQRKLELQQQRRQRADKVFEMQAVQIALRQKHNARLQSKSVRKNKAVEPHNSAVLDRTSTDSVGYIYSLSEQRIAEMEVTENHAKDASKDGRASSMSGESRETEAPTVGSVLQDTDDESVSRRASPEMRESTADEED